MKKRALKILASITPAVCMLCAGCTVNDRFKESTEGPVPVTVQSVHKETTASTSSYVGRVEPSRSAIIISQFPGTVEDIGAVVGRRLAKGAVIARVKSETLQSAYDVAKATLDQAEDGIARAEKVYGSGSVTEARMVEIRTRVEQARAAERSARQALEDCTVKAPFSGVVDEIFCQKGENITAAAPLVRILDVESIEIHFSVPENEYATIPVGAKVTIGIPALKKTVEGTVAVKGVSASPLSHAYDFTVKGISDTFSLMPGMVCKVRLDTEGESSMVIPASAVMTDVDGRYIWGVTTDNTVCKKYITVGGYAEKGIIVSEGIEEGDRIIVEGSRKASTGMKVKAIEK